ncbi:hypothetical protein DSO57_1021770 [Entomophthora muscae]|uniref:Uncharacterized protein n=1 Tax=Entomophthora muscae TaxID=34485 RepID=A0ACC2TRC5_9FUNG|nr:hypothetical protein DSO57_1021770 [Entomophthora muscae]
MFASICKSTTQYNCAYLFPPVSAPVHLVRPPCAIDLGFFHPHHLDLPPSHSRGPILTIMKEIPFTPPLPNVPPAQDFSKLGFVYITVLGLANQTVLHTGSCRPLATTVNYIFSIAPIVYMALYTHPVSPVGVQLDSETTTQTANTIPNIGSSSPLSGKVPPQSKVGSLSASANSAGQPGPH